MSEHARRHAGGEMTAAEEAMEEIGALLAAHASGKRGALEVLNDIHRTFGAYGIERIGEGK